MHSPLCVLKLGVQGSGVPANEEEEQVVSHNALAGGAPLLQCPCCLTASLLHISVFQCLVIVLLSHCISVNIR